MQLFLVRWYATRLQLCLTGRANEQVAHMEESLGRLGIGGGWKHTEKDKGNTGSGKGNLL